VIQCAITNAHSGNTVPCTMQPWSGFN